MGVIVSNYFAAGDTIQISATSLYSWAFELLCRETPST